MNDSLLMTKYYDREQFSYEEKADICAKSGNVCSHCGKTIFANYGATIDHFIPLNKGGSNRYINLIPLCEDCNKAKEDKLYSIDYAIYLKDKYKKELSNYLESYIQVTDYVKRSRLLAYDEYDGVTYTLLKNKKFTKKYKLKLATWNDFAKIYEYFIKYLKKNNALKDANDARENLIFWMQFGSIYYVELENDIKVMIAITIRQFTENNNYRSVVNQPCMFIFSYYKTELSYNIVKNIIVDIPNYIMKENNLEFIPFNIIFLKADDMSCLISAAYEVQQSEDLLSGFTILRLFIDDNKEGECFNTKEFFKKFNDVTNQLIKFFTKFNGRQNIAWMATNILDTELIMQNPELAELVKDEL